MTSGSHAQNRDEAIYTANAKRLGRWLEGFGDRLVKAAGTPEYPEVLAGGATELRKLAAPCPMAIKKPAQTLAREIDAITTSGDPLAILGLPERVRVLVEELTPRSKRRYDA